MIKKYLLKGKQLLSKKLQQYEIDSAAIDYVNDQIPNKLKEPLSILQQNIDLESNQKYELYFKMYPNHHLSSFLLQKYNLLVNTDTQTPLFILPRSPVEESAETYFPKHYKQLQNKAMIFKEVIQQYQEGYYKLNQAILCMSVVHFHHKRGAEVEYTYPHTTTTQAVQNLIVHHSMPDSSHNKNEDYNFFNFQTFIKGKKKMLFGVSYFKQIKVTQEHREQNKQLTRSYLQKAICIISYLPLFGYLKMRLSSTVKVFFNDFNNFKIIDEAYKDFDKSLTDTWPQISINQLYIGSDLRTIINLFGPNDFYQIWKAILYQKRVVVFAHSSSSASSFILSLLTLFPGVSAFGVYSQQASKYMQGLRQYALPLKLFSTQNFMSMSFHIQDFNLLIPFQKNNKGSFLVGTTNRLLKQQNDYGVQMLVNLQNCTIEKRKHPHTNWEALSKREKIFLEELNQLMQRSKSSGYSSTQDKIRNHFHNFLKESLVKIMIGIKQFKKFVRNCKQYETQTNCKANKRKSSKGTSKEMGVELNEQDDESEYQNNEGKVEKDFPPMIPDQVISMPFPQLLLSPSFQFFLQFHNDKLPQLIKGQITPGLLIDNFKYLLKLDENKFILYDWNNKKISFGKGNPKTFQGQQIKFHKHYQETNDNNQKIVDNQTRHVKSVFIGAIENGKYHKNGFFMDKTQIYEGDFQKGMKQGYGKLINTLHKYIGNFQQDLYSGQGQLVTLKQIYVGQFKQGFRNGSGKNQSYSKGLNYDGEWLNDKPDGSGIMKDEKNTEIIGIFRNGKLAEEYQVSFKYQDGSIYKGIIKNGIPHGKGFIVDQSGKLKIGLFQQGLLIHEQSDELELSAIRDNSQINKQQLSTLSSKITKSDIPSEQKENQVNINKINECTEDNQIQEIKQSTNKNGLFQQEKESALNTEI